MKPFLILQLRPEDVVSDNEFEAMLSYGGLAENEVRRVRLEQGNIPQINIEDYSAVLMGGGPFNFSDSEEEKSVEQKEAEGVLHALLTEIIEKDIPYLGACCGISALALCCNGGVVSKEKYAEGAGGVTIKLTEEGLADPLLAGLPGEFRAFGGHKESCQELPEGAVLLASSDACPIQMIRVKNNVYGAQFHPELAVEGMAVRIDAYKHKGYFLPEEAEALLAETQKEKVFVPMEILKRFVLRYKRN